jgi:outer membrane lipoprotein SlyB
MYLKLIIGTIVGAALGLLYYKLVGCQSGSCPITAKPHRTAIYGAILGFMISSSF